MRVRFESSCTRAQLHLADRKLLSARLARLIAVEATRIDALDAAPPELEDFVDDTASAIRQVLRAHERKEVEPPVDATLEEISKRLHRSPYGAENERLSAGMAAFQAEVTRIRCGECSAYADRICGGFFNDFRLFEDGDGRTGGMCVEFVRAVTRHLFGIAEEMLKEFANGAALRPAPDEIVIRMSNVGDDHDETLPLEGSYDPVAGAITIQWPADPDKPQMVDEAVLMLPYLIFHEVFVHGGQGRALPEPILHVLPQCAFTEGAADAVARDLLLVRVLGNTMPPPFSALHGKVLERCQRYAAERSFEPEPSELRLVRSSTSSRVRRARSEGTIRVWQTLKQVEELAPRPRDWARSIIVSLNLSLNADQRDDFMMATAFWDTTNAGFRDDLAAIFDRYLESRDTNALLVTLARLGLP